MTLENSDSKRHLVGIRRLFTVTAIVALGCSAALAAGQSEPQKTAQTSTARHVPPPQTGQQTFSSAHEATQALVTAMKNNDQQSLLKVLGPNAKSIVSSGDDAEDQNDRDQFLKKYQQMHRLVMEP